MTRVTISTDQSKIEVDATHGDGAKLQEALEKPEQFATFKANPSEFLQAHGLKVDPALASQLKAKLAGVNSLAEFQEANDGSGATAAAIAKGAFAFTSSKIAVAW